MKREPGERSASAVFRTSKALKTIGLCVFSAILLVVSLFLEPTTPLSLRGFVNLFLVAAVVCAVLMALHMLFPSFIRPRPFLVAGLAGTFGGFVAAYMSGGVLNLLVSTLAGGAIFPVLLVFDRGFSKSKRE